MGKSPPLQPETFAYLQLARSHGIGPVTIAGLVSRFGSAIAAVEAIPDLIRDRGLRAGSQLADARACEQEAATLLSHGGQMICPQDAGYPDHLREIAGAPPILSVLGDGALLSKPAIAIVGARNASGLGLGLAEELAADLGEAGYVIVSGLARGLDAAAHRASLRTGTVCVLAGGVDCPYPPQNRGLYDQVRAQGAIVSEQPLGLIAKARDFPKRNRIVSGLSLAVVVVEAAERSGTLITARLAAEQGRDVCAVPGSPREPRSAGTNRLIKEGAALIRNADDVLDAIAAPHSGLSEPSAPFTPLQTQEEPDPALREELLSLLTVSPIGRDELCRLTGHSVPAVTAALLDLVLDGLVEEVALGAFVLADNRAST